MKKPLTLFLGLLLYSTTPSAKTLVMECGDLNFYQMKTDEDTESERLLTERIDGVWKGHCQKPYVECSKGDDSVTQVITLPTDKIPSQKLVYDFKFATSSIEHGDLKYKHSCKRMTL